MQDELANERAQLSLKEEVRLAQQKRESEKSLLRENGRIEARLMHQKRAYLYPREKGEKSEQGERSRDFGHNSSQHELLGAEGSSKVRVPASAELHLNSRRDELPPPVDSVDLLTPVSEVRL